MNNFDFLVTTLSFYLNLFSKHSVSCFYNQKTNIILKILLVWERSTSTRPLKQKPRALHGIMQSEHLY